MRRTNQTLAAALAATVALGTAPAFAGGYAAGHHGGHDGAYLDYARVTAVQPVTRSVRVSTPRRECWSETVPVQPSHGYRSYTPEIVGSVIGAVVGNQFGSGSGRDIATVAGAVLGGSLGHDYKNRRAYAHGPAYDTIERCETVHDEHFEDRIIGYDVSYLYDGRTYHTRTDRDPGDRLRVRVEVTPAE